MKLYVVGILVAILIIAGAVATLALSRKPVPEEFRYDFEKLYRLYDEEKFEEAARAYQALLNRYKVASPDLYFNLANSYFKAGEIGRAILYYRKALRLKPGDQEIKFNLDFARRELGLPAPENSSWFKQKFRAFINLVSLNRAVKAAIILYWLVLLALVGYLFTRSRAAGYCCAVIGAIFLVLLGYAVLKHFVEASHREGVVLSRQADVKYSCDEGDDVAFTLVAGTEAAILNVRGQWYQVRTRDGRVGWIRGRDFGEIGAGL